jgi:hypothetical protein
MHVAVFYKEIRGIRGMKRADQGSGKNCTSIEKAEPAVGAP